MPRKSSSPSMPCPIRQDAEQIQLLAHDLVKTMRKLRRDLRTCRSCLQAPTCPALHSFNTLVGNALQEIGDEWTARG